MKITFFLLAMTVLSKYIVKHFGMFELRKDEAADVSQVGANMLCWEFSACDVIWKMVNIF